MEGSTYTRVLCCPSPTSNSRTWRLGSSPNLVSSIEQALVVVEEDCANANDPPNREQVQTTTTAAIAVCGCPRGENDMVRTMILKKQKGEQDEQQQGSNDSCLSEKEANNYVRENVLSLQQRRKIQKSANLLPRVLTYSTVTIYHIT